MRIGIVTFFASYGGALQCYALQRVLRSMGHEVYVVNRKWGPFKPSKRISQFAKLKHYIHGCVIKDPFISFYKKYYKFTDPVISNNILRDIGTKKYFDVMIVGSDQPWNPDCIKVMGYYFYLDWVASDVRKYAYAVSYGKGSFNATQKEIEEIKSILTSYQSISVREKSGIDITKNLFNIEAQLCLDPTLLLSQRNYNDIIVDKRKSHKYICEFFLDPSPIKHDLVVQIAEREHIAIINNKPLIPKRRLQRLFYAPVSISRWLRNIRDAKYVITDSFHGTVFSILFHKKFISINNKERGSARFESLLSMTNLMCRLQNVESIDFENIYSILKNEINYYEVDRIIEKMKENSLSYLKSIK